MNNPYFFQSNVQNHLICEPVSTELLISAIGRREFRTAELYYYSNDSFQGKLQTVHLLPDDSPYIDRLLHPSGGLFDYL
jgi:hypothetical protein